MHTYNRIILLLSKQPQLFLTGLRCEGESPRGHFREWTINELKILLRAKFQIVEAKYLKGIGPYGLISERPSLKLLYYPYNILVRIKPSFRVHIGIIAKKLPHNEVLGTLFQGIGETSLNLRTTIIHAIFLVPLALTLMRTYEVQGLIMATLISNLASTLYSLKVATGRFKLKIDLKASLKIYAASALSAAPTIIFMLGSPLTGLSNLIAGATIYLFTYLTITPIIKAIDEQDIKNLTQISRGIKTTRPITKILLKYTNKLLSIT